MRLKEPFFTEPLHITDIDQEGRGVARLDECVVFVGNALPGDVAIVKIHKKKSRYWEGVLYELTEPSPFRSDPVCEHFGICGGCQWQNFQYSAQLKFKAQSVSNALQRIGGLTFPEPKPIVSSEKEYYYRNKLNFSFSARSWIKKEALDAGLSPDQPALGFHIKKVFDKVYPIETCHLMPGIVNAIRNSTYTFARNNNYTFYHLKEHTGWLRTLVFRMSPHSGEIMLMLLVAYEDMQAIDHIFTHLKNTFPQITSFVYYINPKLNDSFNDLSYSIWGNSKSFLIEKMGRFRFSISPNSFFQTNTLQAEYLYQCVYNAVGSKVPLIYDLYCGTGSIGIFVSDLADKIVGLEYVKEAVDDAILNCELNGLTHLSFYAGDMKHLLNDALIQKHGRPDIVITDPPRAGMDAPVVSQLLKIAPEKIIYVSCNPATQARDLQLMSDAYSISEVQPVDMFPQTTHVENIVTLIRKPIL